MTIYLIDTNHLSPLITPGHPLQLRLTQHYRTGDRFRIAVPALTELLFGVRMLPRAERNLSE